MTTILLVSLIGITFLAGCSSRTPSSATTDVTASDSPTASGGAPGATVTGHLWSTDGENTYPVANVSVGLFPHAFLPGSNALAGSSGAGGKAVALTRTDSDGGFTFTDVQSGVWFLAPTTTNAGGRWVRVTEAEGTSIDLLDQATAPPVQ